MSFLKRFQTSLNSLNLIIEHQKATLSSYVIAYSGGVDSHVLLHCYKQLGLPVRAVHVHHGLQAVADDWVLHCQKICDEMDVPLNIIYVDAKKRQGDSPEESARKARYQALKENLAQGEFLVTAQHLNDQAETFLLQLFRTASAAGLAAMPAYKQFGKNIHIRPLLSFSRKEIEDYAQENKLHWVEDPSNLDAAFDRNYLRKEVLPKLEGRWPEIATQLSTVASLQSNNLQVLEDMAAIDLAKTLSVQNNSSGFSIIKVISMLSINVLSNLSVPRLLNLLRYWIITTVEIQPTRKLLEEIESSLINSQADAIPEIVFSGYMFRKFQDGLYLLKENDNREVQSDLDWQPSSPLILPDLNIQLKSENTVCNGLVQKLKNETLKLSFRKGGEKFHPAGRRHSQSLKKLFQEAGIPPWERDLIPLLYFGDELVAVAGLWVSKAFSVADGESGWVVTVERLS